MGCLSLRQKRVMTPYFKRLLIRAARAPGDSDVSDPCTLKSKRKMTGKVDIQGDLKRGERADSAARP